jgi:hypothetical protein
LQDRYRIGKGKTKELRWHTRSILEDLKTKESAFGKSLGETQEFCTPIEI